MRQGFTIGTILNLAHSQYHHRGTVPSIIGALAPYHRGTRSQYHRGTRTQYHRGTRSQYHRGIRSQIGLG